LIGIPVALPAAHCAVTSQGDLVQIALFQLNAAPHHHSVRHNDRDYIVYCFADASHADIFRETFKGEKFNPSEWGRGAS
jgi:hypothetical protein